MIRKVLRMGDPRLLAASLPVTEFGTSRMKELIIDMRDTMAHLDGAGLAAPQIGVGLRVVIFGVNENARYPDAEDIPETILVNPVILPLGDEQDQAWEGCLSVPGMRGVVPRWKRIRYSGFDENGLPIDRVAQDFHARVVQHECDHLDGILYPVRISDLRQFGYNEELFPGVELPRE